ncbi:hypothetical protein D3931_24255 [Escherichia coli]|nr:hypothetical protein [Escherichia coli]
MNKIYCLKYCHITKNLIAVSELAPAKAIADFHVGLFLCLLQLYHFLRHDQLCRQRSVQRSLIRYSATLPRIKVSLRRGPRIFSFTASRAIWSVNLIKPR